MNLKQEVKLFAVRGLALGAGFSIFVSFAALLAQSLNTFSEGDLISASKINDNFAIAAPTGAIMGFYLSACPTGWVAADGTNSTPDLRGSFLRARDPGNATGRDPDGDRAVGNYQTDAFQGHRHTSLNGTFVTVTSTGGSFALAAGSDVYYTDVTTNDPVTDLTNGAPRTANETRSENVALTFCMRLDT